jgi:hypothetical protein
MSTAQQRQEWRELAEDYGLLDGNNIVLALLADVDQLTKELEQLRAQMQVVDNIVLGNVIHIDWTGVE